jgi:hypothetical protein
MSYTILYTLYLAHKIPNNVVYNSKLTSGLLTDLWPWEKWGKVAENWKRLRILAKSLPYQILKNMFIGLGTEASNYMEMLQ